ncbi:MAG: ABC transporter permease [Actinomycetota bacterium]
MLDIALKNITARKTRSGLTILGVLICVFLIGIISGLANGMEEDLAGDVATLGDKMYFQQKGAPYPPFGSTLNESIAEQLLARDDVDARESTGILFSVIEPPANPRETARVFGVGLAPGREGAYIGDARASAGSGSLEGTTGNAVILGSSAADFYDADVGDAITLRPGASVEIVGILDPADTANTDNAVLMSMGSAQALFGREGSVSAVVLTPADGHSQEETETDLEAAFPNAEVRTETEIVDELDASLATPRTILGMINTVVFVVTIIIIMNVMMMSVKEKTREIGTMRAIGAKRSVVILIIFYETLILSVIGGVLGLLAIVPGSYIVGAAATTALSRDVLIRVAALVLLMGGFSGLLPAYMATRVSPLEALRYE